MIEIKNRLPTKPNRWKITHESDSSQEYITWDYADEPTEAGTPINRGLIVGMYNDMTPCGIVKIFSSKEEREGYLLCNGSSIMGNDYPDLIGKLKSYDIYQYGLTVDDVAGYHAYGSGTAVGANTTANGKFFFMSGYGSGENEHKKVWVSDDGEDWTQILTNYDFSNGNDTLSGVRYINNTYFIFARYSEYPNVFYGSDLSSLTRTRIMSVNTSWYIQSIGNIGNTLVVLLRSTGSGTPLRAYYSTNGGSTWTQATLSTNETYSSGFCILKTVNNKMYFATSSTKLYYSSDGITWTWETISDAERIPRSYDAEYNNYIYRLNGTTLKRTQDYETWTTLHTYDFDVTGTSFSVDRYGNAFLSRGSSDYNDIPPLFSTDLETFTPIYPEYVTNSYIGSIASNGIIALSMSSSTFLKYDIGINNPKLVLPTLNDDTNQLYGYIKTEVE